MSDLRLVVVDWQTARGFCQTWHRHHPKPPPGHLFRTGVAAGPLLVGVAIVGRPVSFVFDDGQTVEVNRTVTDGYKNANSMLYATPTSHRPGTWSSTGPSTPTGKGKDTMTRQPETSGALLLGEACRAPDAKCGTMAGAQRHRRRGQQPCQPCREALRTYNREYARLARESAAWRARTAATKKRWDLAHRAQISEARRELERKRRSDAQRESLVDWVAVQRLADGQPVPHNRAERLEAVRQLRNRRYGYNDIAARLNMAARQVHRDLADLGLVDRKETVA